MQTKEAPLTLEEVEIILAKSKADRKLNDIGMKAFERDAIFLYTAFHDVALKMYQRALETPIAKGSFGKTSNYYLIKIAEDNLDRARDELDETLHSVGVVKRTYPRKRKNMCKKDKPTSSKDTKPSIRPTSARVTTKVMRKKKKRRPSPIARQ
jgi:hypothetical protein